MTKENFSGLAPEAKEASPKRHDFQQDLDAVAQSDAVPTILDTVCMATGMGFAAVARVTDERWVTCRAVDHINFGLRPGDELEVESTLCHEVRQAQQEIVISDVHADEIYCDHHTPARYGFRSYISVPVLRADGTFFGTLCAIDPEPRELHNQRVLNMFRLFARMVGESLDVGRRLLDAESRLAEEKDLSRLQDEFVAILGHDLRNPVAAMQAGVRLLSRQPLGDQSREIVKHFRASLHRMSGLIENILQHARIELGSGIAIQPATCFQLGRSLTHVIGEIEAVAPDRALVVEIDGTGDVYCDEARLGQLLSNLLANAIAHGDPQEPVAVTIRTTADQFMIAVENGGDQIPAAEQGQLFERYARGAMRSDKGGLGLGLYIASQIAKGHGGMLHLSSDAKHTRFTFTMPRRRG